MAEPLSKMATLGAAASRLAANQSLKVFPSGNATNIDGERSASLKTNHHDYPELDPNQEDQDMNSSCSRCRRRPRSGEDAVDQRLWMEWDQELYPQPRMHATVVERDKVDDSVEHQAWVRREIWTSSQPFRAPVRTLEDPVSTTLCSIWVCILKIWYRYNY